MKISIFHHCSLNIRALENPLYRRIQERFRAQGIEFAHRNVTVYLPSEVTGAENGEDLEENPVPDSLDKRVLGAGAAAVAAVQAEELKNKPKK